MNDSGDDDDEPIRKPEAEHTVVKLLESIDNGTITIFDQREARALRQMAQLWMAFETFGRLANVIRGIAIWIGWPVGIYLAWKAGGIGLIKVIFFGGENHP